MNEPNDRSGAKGRVQVQVSDAVIGGVYSNHMVVSHTGEEFFLDFFTMLPQVSKLAARVIVSPGHMKRILRALSENLSRYEERNGPIQETPAPPTDTVN
jgi:hypothetical protein